MIFKSAEPGSNFTQFIKSFWVVEDPQPSPQKRKIIPDGFPEIIIHYKEPYKIKLHSKWETQTETLFAGQITSHFYLENTGASGMVGLKLMPTAAYQLFGVNMSSYVDRVVPLNEVCGDFFEAFRQEMKTGSSPDFRIKKAEQCFKYLIDNRTLHNVGAIKQAVDSILKHKGMIKIEAIAAELDFSFRHLQREFKRIVGLSPKFFSRITRFNYIFEIMKQENSSWIGIALDSGYFDQSHFIKEFKAFTGEEPSNYGFDEETMANFFLKKD